MNTSPCYSQSVGGAMWFYGKLCVGPDVVTSRSLVFSVRLPGNQLRLKEVVTSGQEIVSHVTPWLGSWSHWLYTNKPNQHYIVT